MQVSDTLGSVMDHIGKAGLLPTLKIHTTLRRYLGDFFTREGFLEVPPVIISPMTDPLNHPHYDPVIEYYGMPYSLTKSMIFHKQILVKYFGSVFTFSPNIRLETEEKSETGRHLSEFTQVDVERKDASREDMMQIVERLLPEMFRYVSEKNSEELKFLKRELKIPKPYFRRVKYLDAVAEYGDSFEKALSDEMEDPFWIIDIPLEKREFYDKLNDDGSDTLADMDLVYPEGYQEALSGGEREFDLSVIKDRIRRKGQTEKQFELYLKFAETGLPPCAGFGLGIERLVRYVCGFKKIEDVHPFPKIPGRFSL